MPSQFRFFGSTPPPAQASPEAVSTSPNETTSLNVNPLSIAPETSPEDLSARPPVAEPTDERRTISGVHDVIKSTDFWFNYELSLLEKNAVTSAAQWAQAGIPRQDAPLESELPIETTLKARAAEIFQGWIARIQRKVQDSIQAASSDAGSKIVQFRYAITQLEASDVEIRAMKEKLRDREEALRNQQKTFSSPALLSKWVYYPLLLGVAVIDWVANVPIFSELLPQEPGSRLIWRKLVADSSQHGAVGGLYRLGDRILFQPDVTIFALGVVVFLMALAHFGGHALRHRVVFQPKDEPLLSVSLSARRRQALVPLIASIVGIVLTVVFLFLSRDRLVYATANGKATMETALHDLEKQKLETQKADIKSDQFNKLQLIEQSLESARTALKDWEERDRFAKDISTMNRPILLLNCVLALTAFIASYCAAAPKFVEGRLVDPVIPELKSELASLQLERVNHRQLLRTLDTEIQTSIAQAKYLAGTHPLSDSEAKGKRLAAVVPLFRAENARARGVDPESIVAFRQPAVLELPDLPSEPFQVPIELVTWEDEFKILRRVLETDTLSGRPMTLEVAA